MKFLIRYVLELQKGEKRNMKKLICQNCKHFRVHYIKGPGGIFRRKRGGHCVYPRLKLRYGETPACAHFRPAEPPDENLH